MTRNRASVLVLALVLTAAVAGCAPAAPPAPEMNAPADIAAVNATRDAFLKAFNAGDAAGAAAGYTADAISMGNHQPSAVGREAIITSMKGMFDQATVKFELMPDETRTMGNSGWERGRYKMTMTPKAAGAAPMSDEGRYIVLLEKGADGAWKVSRDIDNSTMPMPAMPAPPAKGKGK